MDLVMKTRVTIGDGKELKDFLWKAGIASEQTHEYPANCMQACKTDVCKNALELPLPEKPTDLNADSINKYMDKVTARYDALCPKPVSPATSSSAEANKSHKAVTTHKKGLDATALGAVCLLPTSRPSCHRASQDRASSFF